MLKGQNAKVSNKKLSRRISTFELQYFVRTAFVLAKRCINVLLYHHKEQHFNFR